MLSAPASASTVDVRCAKLSETQRGELEARARLFFTSAGMETASVAVECDATSAWLIWVDGSKTQIDQSFSIVEGALDAIEDRLGSKRQPEQGGAGGSPMGREGPPGLGPTPDDAASLNEDSPKEGVPEKPVPGSDLEGGVGLAMLTEFWGGELGAGMGPRLDVGVGLGKKLALVVSEGARFAVGSGTGQVMAFDLQAGIAYGAPYQTRTGIGIVALAGAERLAASARIGASGLWTWAATGSLGLRGSLAAGPVDAWIGVDGMLRSSTIETGGPHPVSVPSLSAILSIGCFLPAFARTEEGYVAARRYRVVQ